MTSRRLFIKENGALGGRGALALLVVTVASGCGTFTAAQRDSDTFSNALEHQRRGEQRIALALYRALDPVDNRYLSALNNMAIIYAREGSLQRAEQLLAKAVELEPDSVVSWANLGLIRAMQGDRANALAALREVPEARKRLLERVSGIGRSGVEYQDLAAATERPVAVAHRTVSLLDRQRRMAREDGSRDLLLAL